MPRQRKDQARYRAQPEGVTRRVFDDHLRLSQVEVTRRCLYTSIVLVHFMSTNHSILVLAKHIIIRIFFPLKILNRALVAWFPDLLVTIKQSLLVTAAASGFGSSGVAS